GGITAHYHIFVCPAVCLVYQTNGVVEMSTTPKHFANGFPFQKQCFAIGTLRKLKHTFGELARLRQRNVVQKKSEFVGCRKRFVESNYFVEFPLIKQFFHMVKMTVLFVDALRKRSGQNQN